jgi:serine/threonine protein kinase HipA of HipAB toxin-antitoxin module
VEGGGGAVTWFWLGAARYGLLDAPSIAAALRQDAWISTDHYARFVRAHAFAAAMGNNDTHAGNYGLTVDDHGTHRLAPLYDLAPMALAPRSDELPDAVLAPFPPAADPSTAALVHDLAARIARDAAISPPFAALWCRCAAPTLNRHGA